MRPAVKYVSVGGISGQWEGRNLAFYFMLGQGNSSIPNIWVQKYPNTVAFGPV